MAEFTFVGGLTSENSISDFYSLNQSFVFSFGVFLVVFGVFSDFVVS